MAAELKAAAMVKAGAYKVHKVLSKHELKSIQPHSFVPKTTNRSHPYAISANLLLERALPTRPDQVWVGDITYILHSGWKFCIWRSPNSTAA